MKPNPYADLDQVYAEETSVARVRVRPTPRTPTLDEVEEKQRSGPVQRPTLFKDPS